MTTNLMDEAHSKVSALCQDFHTYEPKYLAAGYSESQARTDFVDKFLSALGWDVGHVYQRNPYEQEVKVERNVAMGAAQKRADYALFAAPNFRDVCLFIEAKKPLPNIATADNCFQTIRYGWNSRTPIAILTDFASLHVLDCRTRPDIKSALNNIVISYKYSDFSKIDTFAEIYWLISHEAVHLNSISKFADQLTKPNNSPLQRRLFGGHQTIDDAFIFDLDSIRDRLATSLGASNPSLSGEDLTEITQRVIDRLVFLRFLEDKLIETNFKVSLFSDANDCWKSFVLASASLDQRYNGAVFKAHALIDNNKSLIVDHKTFSDICDELGSDKSPYDFNAIPIHVLGSIYERFLGKVVTRSGNSVSIDFKPEVKKAGGVFYTPAHIVDFIVNETIGKQIAALTPNQISKMRFADIACGSGSFLLGIFDALIRRHTSYYNSNLERRASFIKQRHCVQGEDGTLHLSLSKRREILLNNIFGVDIDGQAVEVAQISLYLKLLEEETTASARSYQHELGLALLPSLSRNIVCGNSLVETDILDNLFHGSMEEERKLNPMDFDDRLESVFLDNGGFDSIVGNPPYGATLTNEAKKYLKNKYPTVADYETAQFFMLRALEKVRPGGEVSMIVPNTILLNVYAKKFRKNLVTSSTPSQIVDLTNVDVFRNATVRTIIPILTSVAPKPTNTVSFSLRNSKLEIQQQISEAVKDLFFDDNKWRCLHIAQSEPLISKISGSSEPLVIYADVSQGLIPYDKYRGHDKALIKSRGYHASWKKDSTYRKELRGEDVQRYYVHWNGEQWISYGDWLAAPREKRFFTKPRLLIREITDKKTGLLHVAYTDKEFYNTPSIINIVPKPGLISIYFLLGICASRMAAFLHYVRSPKANKGLFPKILVSDVRGILIPRLDFKNSSHKSFHDLIAQIAKQLCDTTLELRQAKLDRDIDYYSGKISALSKQIDNALYKFYGLSPFEIRQIQVRSTPEIANLAEIE